MSSTNFMELTGSGSSSEMSSAMVSTLPAQVSTTVSYHTRYSNDNISDDEKTVAIVLACAFISLFIGWVSHWLYRMSRETRRRRDACAAQMVEEATVTVEASISNTASSVEEGAAEQVESAANVADGVAEHVAEGAERACVTNI